MSTSSPRYAQFFYRSNENGTVDAICGYCFVTVVTANTFVQLKPSEMVHRCSPKSKVYPGPFRAA